MRKPFIFLWVILGSFILFYWIYLPVLSRYRDLKIEEEKIAREIRELDKKIEALREEKNLLKNDMAYLEKVIRDELGLAKPGEVIYKFVTEKDSPPRPNATEETLPAPAAG